MTSKKTRSHKRNKLLAATAGITILFCHSNADAVADIFADAFALGGRNTCGCGTATFHRPFATPQSANSRLVMWGFLDGLFGENDSSKQGNDAILSTIDVKGGGDDIDVRFDSLSDYITDKWMDLFLSKSISLTTPVQVYKGSETKSSDSGSASCKLVFQKVDTGYGDKDDDDENGEEESKDEPKQGGVEIVVQKVEDSTLRVVARRCEVDDDTMIKEMSEEIIVKELQKAIGVWKKETP